MLKNAEKVKKSKDISTRFPIYGSHVKRLGYIRTFAGSTPMYLYIPVSIVMHLTLALVFNKWCLRSLPGKPQIDWKDYVILDRHRIEGLSVLDKFNCLLCGYINGLSTMINREIDTIIEYKRDYSAKKYFPILSMILVVTPLLLLFELFFQLIYNLIISRLLGMVRVSIKEASVLSRPDSYAETAPFPINQFLKYYKNNMFRFAMALEQIESAWCPLKHLEKRKSVVYPDHHKNFFEPDEIEKMREVLLKRGTVSDRIP